MTQIDLNVDVGEGYDDAPLIDVVTSVNVACGAHAGDASTMRTTIAQAAARGVAIGAHPGYEDREHFGRRALTLPPDDVEDLVAVQCAVLTAIADELGARVTHVKPHGALYNQAAADVALAAAVARGAARELPDATLVMLAGSPGERAVAPARVAGEAFADRGYLPDGTLAPRGTPGALITDPARAAAQALAIASGEPFPAVDGSPLRVTAETICLHGDTPGAIDNARAVRAALEAAGIRVAPLEHPC